MFWRTEANRLGNLRGRCASTRIYRCALIIALLAVLLNVTRSTSEAAEPRNVRLRVQWQDDHHAHCRGSIAIDQGKIVHLQNLSFDGLTTGGIFIASGNQKVSIEPRGVVDQAGIIIHAQLPDEATVSIELHGITPGEPQRLSVPLKEITEDPQSHALTAHRRVWISRVAGDGLHVDLGQDFMLFEPGQKLPLVVSSNSSTLPRSTALRCQVSLAKARGGAVAANETIDVRTDEFGQFAKLQPNLMVPAEEGAYDLQVSIVQPQRFQRDRVVATHVTQICVVASSAVASPEPVANLPIDSDGDWQPVATFELTAPNLDDNQWLRERIPNWVPSSLQPEAPDVWANEVPQPRDLLGVKVHDLAAKAWYLKQLTALTPGKPHLAVIQVPAAEAASLQVSIIEPDPSGNIQPIQIDTALVVQKPLIASPQQWVEQRIVFWPRTAQPILLLANHSPHNSVAVAPVKILGGPEHLPALTAAAKSFTNADPANSSEPNSSDPIGSRGRSTLMYFEKPSIADAFGASLVKDPVNGANLHDWVTFHESATRMIEYLRWAGYNGAMITVSSEGGRFIPPLLWHRRVVMTQACSSRVVRTPSRKTCLNC